MTEAIKTIHAYRRHLRYWALIITTVIVFGGLLGAAGSHHVKRLPELSVIDGATKNLIFTRTDANAARIDYNTAHIHLNVRRILALEQRVSNIEQGSPVPRTTKVK